MKTERMAFGDVLALRMSRRDVLRGSAALMAAGVLPLGGCATPGMSTTRGDATLGFVPVTPSDVDAVRVPAGYEAVVLGRWGDPIGIAAGQPAFRMDASNGGADQELQYGMHHDGMQYYALPRDSRNALHGLLALNHEYEDEELLFPDGTADWTADKTRKGQAAVGVSVVEVALDNNRWALVRPSRYARRITASTPIAISGPAAGHPSMRTAADPTGRLVLGTFAGCASGLTPWGTYLTCEENFHFAFTQRGKPTPDQNRYRLRPGASYRWARTDERFDVEKHPNEPNRFGWVVEIDPYDPASRPVKRTAMGRIKHEGAFPSVGPDRRIAFYMGDDEAFEYIYKFVTRDPWNPNDPAANRNLLDAGTLYVARFDADGSGTWLPLVHGVGPLTAANGFADQGEVLVRTRQAADAVGATPMDRPEWTAVHPLTREVYCTLTGNPERGSGTNPGANVANPRAPNPFGHIIRWREAGGDVAATRFAWDIFAWGGITEGDADPSGRRGTKGDPFGSPDGLVFDPRGVLWVATDMSPSVLNRGAFASLGNNQLHAVDPRDGTFRRFLTGPKGCEITGVTFAPDGRSLFVNIQHPGEGGRTDPSKPRALSNWPDFDPAGRPRSATVAIRRADGGIIGSRGRRARTRRTAGRGHRSDRSGGSAGHPAPADEANGTGGCGMRWTRRAATLAAAVIIAGCDGVGYGPGKLQPGATTDEVAKQMGRPTEERQLADGGRVWWYVRGPQGFHTYKIVFDRDGRAASIAQVLTEANFRNIVADRSTRADVLELIGPPRESMKFPNLSEEVSTWRYQDGTFNKYLHVHFTPEGVVKRYTLEMESTSP